MKPPLSYTPLLPLLLSFAAGILLAESSISLYAVITPAILAIILYWKKRVFLAICLMAISAGWLNTEIQSPKPLENKYHGVKRQYTAVVCSAHEAETTMRLVVSIEGIGKSQLTTPSVFPAIKAGDIISFTGELHTPENMHDLPDEWDMESFLHRQGIIATAFLRPEQIDIIGQSNAFIWKIKRLQTAIISLLGASSLSDDTTSFLIATITGDDSLLSTETRNTYSSSGLAHILALSGLHVGIIAFVIAVILFPLYLAGHNRTRFIITIIILWLYAIMTGLSPSVTRAVIMTSVYLIGIIIQRHYSSMNALCCAALIILIFSPMSLYSAGFQLSFAAVVSILLFANRLNPINPQKRIYYNLMSLVTVSVSAMIGTGAIATYYFHSFPLYFLLGNILVISILPVVIGGGVIVFILSTCGYDPHWICCVTDFCYGIIAKTAEFSSSLPGADISGIYFPAWLLLPYFATVTALLCTLVYRRYIWLATTIICLIATISLYFASRPDYPEYEMYLPRDTYYTNVIVRERNIMYLITTAHPMKHAEIIDRTKSIYKDYIGKRGIDSVSIVTTPIHTDAMIYDGKDIFIGDNHYAIISEDNDVYARKHNPRYALVCRGYKGDILDVERIITPDSILLSNDLHIKRHNRYLKYCLQNKIPVRSLRIK